MDRNFTDGYSEWHSNPEITGVSVLPHRATFMPYGSFDEAKKCDRFSSSRCKLLNGKWRFKLYDNYICKPADFAKPEYDSHNWDSVIIPCSWPMQGYDKPQYCNVRYAWEGHEDICPPCAPAKYNPVGCYIKRVRLSAEAIRSRRRFVIVFEGVESAFYLYVNGTRVGYSESSFNRAEFDITNFIVEGSNVIAVEVYRFCTGSWLECQDMWRLGGIFRDVYIYSTEREYIRDFSALAQPDVLCKDGCLDVTIKTNGSYEGLSVEMTLLDADENMVALDVQNANEDHRVFLKAYVADAKMWSSEDPNLYTLVLCLRNDGVPIEYISTRIGFRRIEIREGVIYINNKRVVFKGTNRHEFSCDTGHYVSLETMLDDIRMMKQNNINAVRTSHYPNDPKWLELCDEYGIYVIDENNMEAHGTLQCSNISLPELPGSRREWTNACMDRIKGLYERDKNHACVIAWSLGNESLGGSNVRAMYKYLKDNDPTRFVHYESNNAPDEKDNSDVFSRMYAKPEEVIAFCEDDKEKRPIMLCEYTHAMGNSCGSTSEYTTLWDKYQRFQGAFVWDWVDQTIRQVDGMGVEYLAYGGDFGDTPHDGNFCANGLLFGDRKPSPKLFEIKKLYQNVEFEAIDAERGVFKITNKFMFTNLNKFDFRWQQLNDKLLLREETFVIDLAPGETKIIDLELNRVLSTEWYLRLSFLLAEDTAWASAGHVVAEEQFTVNEFELAIPPIDSDEKLIVTDTYGTLRIISDNMSVAFNRRSNKLKSIKVNGNELLAEEASLNFWRACTDNDRGNRQPVRLACWKYAGEYASYSIDNYEISQDETKVIVTTSAKFYTQPQCSAGIIYTVTAKGVEVDITFIPDASLPEIPEISFMFKLTEGFDSVKYLGNGPHENYIDRCESAQIGLYRTFIDDMFVPYVKPQENGERTAVRYFTVSGKKKKFCVVGAPQFEMNISRYTPDELEHAMHAKELPNNDTTVVRVVARQQGVGGYDSWGAHTNELYKNRTDRNYQLKFVIMADEI